jgi:hypothetical protein
MADVDVLVEPLRSIPVLKALLLGFSPYGFIGFGGFGVRPTGAPDTSFATLSYGAGVHHGLLGALGLEAEARYRRPIESDASLTAGLRENMQYRLGLTVNFGGRHRAARRAAPVRLPPTTPRVRDVPPPEEYSAHFSARVLDGAESFVNAPYRRGGADPDRGFDAGGFVQYVFGREGVRLPRTAARMAQMGQYVPLRFGSIRPGDLLFFAGAGSRIDHVAIYAGHDRIIHSSESGDGVRYDVLGEGLRGRWFSSHLVLVRRVTGNPDAGPPRPDQDDEYLDPPDRAPRAAEEPR